MKKLLEWMQVITTSLLLLVLPACQGSPPMDTESQQEHDELLAEGTPEGDMGAAQIEIEEGEEFVGGIFDAIGQFIPGSMALKAAIVPLVASLAWKRPRERYLAALKEVGKAAVAINPLGSSMAPGEAAAALGNGLRNLGAAWGLKHTTDDPDTLMANAEKLKAKQA